MDYCVVKDGVISNMIVCENDEVAAQFGALASYEGARIGAPYEAHGVPVPDPAYTGDDLLNAILGNLR